MNDHMSEFEYEALVASAYEMDGALGERYVAHCNVTPPDCVTAQRVGMPGARRNARVMIVTNIDGEELSPIVMSAAGARMFAAQLLNMADEIDGKTPLVFFPRDPFTEADPDAGKGEK